MIFLERQKTVDKAANGSREDGLGEGERGVVAVAGSAG